MTKRKAWNPRPDPAYHCLDRTSYFAGYNDGFYGQKFGTSYDSPPNGYHVGFDEGRSDSAKPPISLLVLSANELDGVERPSRDLDARLHTVLFPKEEGMVHPGSSDGLKGSWHGPISGMDWEAWEKMAASRQWQDNGVADHHRWPPYTASITEAAELARRKLNDDDEVLKLIAKAARSGRPLRELPLALCAELLRRLA